jgi:hypothetical protein
MLEAMSTFQTPTYIDGQWFDVNAVGIVGR